MDPDDTPSSPRPSSSSTHIAVGMHLTPEEDLYAMAEAMRKSMHAKSKSNSRSAAATTPPRPSASESSIIAAASQTSLSTSPKTSSRPSSSSASSTTTSVSPSRTTPRRQSGVGAGPPSGTSSGPGPGPGPDSASASASASASESENHFAFDRDMDRYPVSMTSSVRDHVYEGGLRYHAYRAGRYAFPNDETEQNRDDMKHTMTLMLCRGSYFYAPVEEVLERGGEVLDLGTGTGIWAMELGDKYPRSTITGIDLSPIQPTFVPENVHFFVDDFEEEWVDPENKYDFIHLRHTLHSVQDPPALFSRVLRHLKPGGHFEIQELSIVPESDDGTLNPDTPYALRDYLNYLSAGLRALGSDAHAILSLPDRLTAAGFQEVNRTIHKAPLGVWPRDKRLRFCGLFLRTALMDGLRGLSRRPLTALGWTPLQIEMFLVDVRKAIMEEDVHVYFTLHVVHGRKPVD